MSMSGEDVEFDADGVTLRGWFYTAQGTDSPAPAVVMAHGLSGVKEMHLDDFAEVVSFAGHERALEPKRLVVTDGGHFDPYMGVIFDQAAQAACDHFTAH
ncbi:hypothetical protein COO55_39665 [Rhodococcus opacus]|nr:hypothetical protein COO55_39665 [Rhodococcus opacus]